MKLTDREKRLLNGEKGRVPQQAMSLLVKYGEALGAEEMVPVQHIYASSAFCANTDLTLATVKQCGGIKEYFSEFALCGDAGWEIPRMEHFATCLANNIDLDMWEEQEASREIYEMGLLADEFERGIDHLSAPSCAPYLQGISPIFAEHIASMESSAVSFFNSVIGARTNTEGIESATAAAYTGCIPKWGLHYTENRKGTHLVRVTVPVETIMDWGLLGFYFGHVVQEKIPVVDGISRRPSADMLKHCGAAAASSGGVELYHVVGVTPEAQDKNMAFQKGTPLEEFEFGEREKRWSYEMLNSGTSPYIDHVILGCPHYSMEQVFQFLRCLGRRKIHSDVHLWLMVPYTVKMLVIRQGYDKLMREAGVHIIAGACPILGGVYRKSAQSIATDSAKQAKYFRDMTGKPVYFGSMEQCIESAVSGKWIGRFC